MTEMNIATLLVRITHYEFAYLSSVGSKNALDYVFGIKVGSKRLVKIEEMVNVDLKLLFHFLITIVRGRFAHEFVLVCRLYTTVVGCLNVIKPHLDLQYGNWNRVSISAG